MRAKQGPGLCRVWDLPQEMGKEPSTALSVSHPSLPCSLEQRRIHSLSPAMGIDRSCTHPALRNIYCTTWTSLLMSCTSKPLGKHAPLLPKAVRTGRNSASQTGGSEGKLQVGPSLCQGRHPKDGPRKLPASLLFVQHNQPWAKMNGEGQSQADITLVMEEKHQTLHQLLETSYTNVFVTLLPRDSMPETGPICKARCPNDSTRGWEAGLLTRTHGGM